MQTARSSVRFVCRVTVDCRVKTKIAKYFDQIQQHYSIINYQPQYRKSKKMLNCRSMVLELLCAVYVPFKYLRTDVTTEYYLTNLE